MLKVGTYNAIIAPNEYYSPDYSDFASSHKTFKRMMPTFAWEVLEVYSGPPTVSFRWRHWGVMKNDYVGINNKGEKVTAKAHGGPIDVQGVTVATVNDKVQLQSVRTWFDPMDMFRQIAPNGVVKKETVDKSMAQQMLSIAHPAARQHQPRPPQALALPKPSRLWVLTTLRLRVAHSLPVHRSRAARQFCLRVILLSRRRWSRSWPSLAMIMVLSRRSSTLNSMANLIRRSLTGRSCRAVSVEMER